VVDHSVARLAVCVCGGGTRNAFKISIGALFENFHLDNKEEVRG
jgi:hypothetical protein